MKFIDELIFMKKKAPTKQRPRRRRTPDKSHEKLRIQYDGEAQIAQARSPEKIVLYQSVAKVACVASIPLSLWLMPDRSVEVMELFTGIGGFFELKKLLQKLRIQYHS